METIFHKVWRRIFYSLTFRGVLHFLAMNAPHAKIAKFFYRLRGTKIGKNVGLAPGIFLEESRPELITIEDDVQIGPNVMILAHDSSYHCIKKDLPIRYGKVYLKQNAYLGAGVIIFPGVTVGEYSIVGAGAVVVTDIPPRSVAIGVPARVVKSIDEGIDSFMKSGMEKYNATSGGARNK